jgi:hypothetical protein
MNTISEVIKVCTTDAFFVNFMPLEAIPPSCIKIFLPLTAVQIKNFGKRLTDEKIC